MTTQEESTFEASHQVAEKKQTVLGLYVTAQEAYAMWKAEPERIKILDVRTPEEYIFVGHAAMARNIPLLFVKYQWDTAKDEPVVEPNPDFIASERAGSAPPIRSWSPAGPEGAARWRSTRWPKPGL